MQTNMHKHAELMQMAHVEVRVCACYTPDTHTNPCSRCILSIIDCHFHPAPSSRRHGPLLFFFFSPRPSALIPYLLSAAATELVFILTHTHNVRLQSGHIHMLDLITSVPQISDMQFMHHMMAFWDNSVNWKDTKPGWLHSSVCATW